VTANLLNESAYTLATLPSVQQPLLEGPLMQVAYSSEPLPAPVFRVDSDPRGAALRGAAYDGSAAGNRSAKTDGTPGSHPRLFDTSLLLLGGQLAALTAEEAAAGALKDTSPGTPHPLFPFGFPFGALPVGSTFSSSSATGIGLDLLAVVALLVVLSRIGGSSVSPREGFRLVSSPRLVTELPG
jgi:hypothetical protein